MKSENQNIVRNIVGPSFRSPLPFRPDWTIGHLPFSLRVLAGSERIKSSSLRAIIKKLAKFWFELWHVRLKFPASGTLYLGHNGEQKSLTFDGRNTHFASLYQANSEIGYEGEIVALLGAILPNNGIFFDIGSNFGYFALSIAARSGFTGKVHAFEPNEQAFSDLIHLTSQASLDKIVECHQLGLSNKDAEGRLRLDSTHSALSRISADENGEIISLKKLDSLELSTPDLLKIDVEGYEIEVLEGASETISQHQPAIIFENLRDTPLGKSFEPIFFLKNKGYLFFKKQGVSIFYSGLVHD